MRPLVSVIIFPTTIFSASTSRVEVENVFFILVCPKQSTRDKLLGFYFINFWNTDHIIIYSILNLVSKFLDVLSVPHLEKMPVTSQNKDSQRNSGVLVLADSLWAVVCLQSWMGRTLVASGILASIPAKFGGQKRGRISTPTMSRCRWEFCQIDK
jgi:hypothetical protein